ncbi:MAG: hypothetical protein LC672_00810 [Acidobacteria bacterium]|nr:hypothetical protein [Acidobacteriota bacterium]
MRRKTQFGLLCVVCCFVGLTFFQPMGQARGQGTRYLGRYITGTVVGIGGRFAGRARPFTLIVNSYTSPGEVERLNAALQSGGQDEMLRVLSGMDAGRIQVGNSVGVTANVIIATQQEVGTKLTVLFQRNVNFFELRYGTRSADYRFGYAELYLGRKGGNEGTLIPAAKVRLRDGNTWEVEDFGVFPARLMGLQVRGERRAR